MATPYGMMTPEHTRQRAMVSRAERPILNIACKEDPAGLADFGAVNLDIQKYDPSLGKDLTQCVRNYVHGNACALPFPAESFATCVMGEFLEHCEYPKAVEALKEAHRVLKPGGKLIMTFPLDPRPLEIQHNPPVLTEFVKGCWAGHVTVWDEEKREPLYKDTGFKEVFRENTTYLLGGITMGGRALILEKV